MSETRAQEWAIRLNHLLTYAKGIIILNDGSRNVVCAADNAYWPPSFSRNCNSFENQMPIDERNWYPIIPYQEFWKHDSVNVGMYRWSLCWEYIIHFFSFFFHFHWLYPHSIRRWSAALCESAMWAQRSLKTLIDRWLVLNWSSSSLRSPSVDSLALRSVAIRSELKQIASWSHRTQLSRQLISHIANGA